MFFIILPLLLLVLWFRRHWPDAGNEEEEEEEGQVRQGVANYNFPMGVKRGRKDEKLFMNFLSGANGPENKMSMHFQLFTMAFVDGKKLLFNVDF